jgi:hypothetical protein
MPDAIVPRIIGALEQAGIPYMLTGSFAGAYHGVPRATQDIDMVIAPTAEQLAALVDLLPADTYYVDREAALDALRRESQFNVIDLATGWKVDLIVRKSRPFSRSEFARRATVEHGGTKLVIVSAEDLILAKMEWAKRGGSQRQIEDAAGILRTRFAELDTDYLDDWIRELRLEEQWQAAFRAAGTPARENEDP